MHATQVHARMLLVQKDMHSELRQGYYALQSGYNDFFRHGANISAAALERVHTFPAVDKLLEDGTFS